MISFILFLFALPSIITLFAIGISFFKNIEPEKTKWWRWQILVAYDQLINAIFMGWADESVSSRSYRKSLENPCFNCEWSQKLIDKIFFFDPNHCEEAYKSERDRLQMPPALRGAP